MRARGINLNLDEMLPELKIGGLFSYSRSFSWYKLNDIPQGAFLTSVTKEIVSYSQNKI